MERFLKVVFLFAVMFVTFVGVHEGAFAWAAHVGMPPETLKANAVFNVVGPLTVGTLAYCASLFTDKLATKLARWFKREQT